MQPNTTRKIEAVPAYVQSLKWMVDNGSKLISNIEKGQYAWRYFSSFEKPKRKETEIWKYVEIAAKLQNPSALEYLQRHGTPPPHIPAPPPPPGQEHYDKYLAWKSRYNSLLGKKLTVSPAAYQALTAAARENHVLAMYEFCAINLGTSSFEVKEKNIPLANQYLIKLQKLADESGDKALLRRVRILKEGTR